MPDYPHGWDAARLHRIGSTLHEASGKPSRPGILSRWLHGPKYTDIFVDIAPRGSLERVEISYGGFFLLWEADGVLRTGTTDEMTVRTGAPASRFIQEHPVPEPAILNGARTLVAALNDRNLAEQILAVLPQGT
jgi:hypothetical protein